MMKFSFLRHSLFLVRCSAVLCFLTPETENESVLGGRRIIIHRLKLAIQAPKLMIGQP